MAEKEAYIKSINYFRGIAILFIVSGHCFGMAGWGDGSTAQKILFNVILGGTSLFVFISGFLFHHIFYRKFEYRSFIRSKIRNVLSPYLVFALPTVSYFVLFAHHGPGYGFYFTLPHSFFNDTVRPFVLYLWTGGFFNAYWYIPFIMTVFFCAPLFVNFIQWKTPYQISLTIVWLVLSSLIHRPVDNHSVIQSVVYFTPVYLVGILSSVHRDRIYKILSGKDAVLLCLTLILAAVQTLVFRHQGNFHKPPFPFTVPDIMMIQKLAMCYFFMAFLNRFESVRIPVLGKIADASFAIFFIHPVILDTLDINGIVLPVRGYGIGSWLLSVILLTGASYGIALFLKTGFRRKSRMFIGW
jgi:peptidoglycan/LPS O-acetylase OafA/YrhL